MIGISTARCGSVAAAAAAACVASSLRAGADSPDDEFHEHAIEPPDQVPLEPLSPHPGSDPVEVPTEPRSEHPERRRPRLRGVAVLRGTRPAR